MRTSSLIQDFNFFKIAVPSFTINNKKNIGTSVGFFLSVFITILLLLFAGSKLILVVNKSEAIVTQFTKDHASKTVDIDAMGFHMAFRVNSGRKGGWKPLDDPDFVEFSLAVVTKNSTEDGEVTRKETPIGYHPCTSDDQAEFYTERYTNRLPAIIGSYYCFNKTDKFGVPIDFRMHRTHGNYRKI